MADPQYDAYRDRPMVHQFADEAATDPPFDIDPDAEGPETSEDRYWEVVYAEVDGEELPPKIHTRCPACSLTFLFADAEECDNCGAWLHVECRHQCERCSDWFCPSCNPSGTCQGCRDVGRYREYSAI